ncbi:MAG: hypothetical protein ACFB4I_10675 [Cyanophyceae cyanobacterium]
MVLGSRRKSFGGTTVRLEPDVAEIFPSADAVNEALRFLQAKAPFTIFSSRVCWLMFKAVLPLKLWEIFNSRFRTS